MERNNNYKFGSLVEVSPEEYKRQILGILKRIHEVCSQYGIRYTVIAGTLIGAIRHNGFIPWDDDIDVMMPREDYELFKKHFTSEDGRYYVLNQENSGNYYNNFARACDGEMILRINGACDIENLGAFVDVFFLDRCPESREEWEKYKLEIRKAYDNVIYALPEKILRTHRFKRWVKIHLLFWKRIYNRYIIGLKRRKEEKQKLLLRYMDMTTGWRAVSCERMTIKNMWFLREEELDKRILVKFENLDVYAPERYDWILSTQYGDYMQLPPEEQRKSHHHFTAYWRNGRGG